MYFMYYAFLHACNALCSYFCFGELPFSLQIHFKFLHEIPASIAKHPPPQDNFVLGLYALIYSHLSLSIEFELLEGPQDHW